LPWTLIDLRPKTPDVFTRKTGRGYIDVSHCENLRHRFELWLGSQDCFRSPAGRLILA
jgi:hypothetical protein